MESHRSGCTVCGARLVYSGTNRASTCHYCGTVVQASACCANGHYVCDRCHGADAVEVIKSVCLESRQTDLVALMQAIRSHPGFRVHGPEHHPMVPAVILTALRSTGCSVTYQEFLTAIQRGQAVGGGACAFQGACGAAIGVGIAVSLLLAATPHDGEKRRIAQQATNRALGAIASFNAPRCCQRDSWLALKEASIIIEELSGVSLEVRPFPCEQHPQNKECIREQCPLWPGRWLALVDPGAIIRVYPARSVPAAGLAEAPARARQARCRRTAPPAQGGAMRSRVLVDRLIDLCARHADRMAEQWCQSLISNPRTPSFAALNKEGCQRHAAHIYRNLGRMYLAEDPYQAVAHNLDVTGLAEDWHGRGVPVEEMVYALVLMRRQIWLHSEGEALYVTPEDMNEVVVSINRVTLLFDYATHRTVARYRQMSRAAVTRL